MATEGATRTTIEEISPPAGGPAAAAGPETLNTAAPHGLSIYDALLLGMVTTWAANPAAIKWALQYIDPLVFNAFRFALATAVPVILLLTSKESFKWRKGDGPKIFGLGMIGHGFYQLLFITSVNNTLAGNVALILSISPAFIAIFGALFGYEEVKTNAWIGVALTLSGVALVVLGSGEKLEFGPRLFGDLLAVATVILWALYTVLSQGLLKRYSSVKLNALTMPWGAALLLLVATPAISRTAPSFPSVQSLVWIILAASGIFAISISYIIWYKGIQKLGATRTSVYSNLVPVLAAIISYLVLGERLDWQFWLGMALVLAGVSLARFGERLFSRRGSRRGSEA